MKIKLTRDVLVGPSDVMPTAAGTVVDIDDGLAREFIANGLAEEGGTAKKSPEPQNKMAAEPQNKARSK